MHIGLIVLSGIHKGRHIPLNHLPFMIGRGKNCHLRPVREDVGREHCALMLKNKSLFLRDYGSTNGTILNRRRMIKGEVEVADGDVFQVGPLQFRLVVTRDPVPEIIPAEDDESCFSVNEIFSGQPGEHEPKPDSTIQISDPHLVDRLQEPMSDEVEKLL